MQDIDLYRAASEMIKQHGEDAVIEAAMKSDAMLAKGDAQGAKIWGRISSIISSLQDQRTGDLTKH